MATPGVLPRPRPRASEQQAAEVDSDSFWSALALVLVIEGALPLMSPRGWRRTFEQILQMRDGQIRFFGLCSIAVGLLLLSLLN